LTARPIPGAVDAAGGAPHDSEDRRDAGTTGVRLSTEPEFINQPCLNCGDATPGRYCRACGQRKGAVRVSMRRLLADVLEDQLSINSALPRTLKALFLHPGRLTREYSNGRIAAYIAPFRLYLVASLLFFLTLSVASRTGLAEVQGSIRSTADAAATAADTVAAVIGQAAADSTASGQAVPDSTQEDTAEAAERPGGAASFGIFLSEEDMQGDSINWSEVINTGIPVLDEMIESRARSMGRMEPREAVRQLVAGFFEYAPAAMFVLLPVFALMLKLLYIRSGRFYVEHFVFALHYHAFAFLLFTAIILLPDAVRPGFLLIWLFLYLPIALKQVYQQRLLTTIVKWWTVSGVYSFMIAIGMFATAIVAFLLG
jgi:hypothetical protein